MERRQFLGSAGLALFIATLPRSVLAASTGTPADAKLTGLLEKIFEALIQRTPELATSLGFDKGERAALKSRLNGYSKASLAKDLAAAKGWLAQVRGIDRKGLSAAGALNQEVAVYLLEAWTKGPQKYDYGWSTDYYAPYALSQLTGPYASVPDFLDSQHATEQKADADAYLDRLRAFARALDESTAFQRVDFQAGTCAPDFCLDVTLKQLNALRDQPAARTVLVSSLARRTREKGIAGDHAAQAEKIVIGEVFPALDRQIALVREMRKSATHEAGVWRLRNGNEYYADALMNSTTTRLTPEEVHRLGLEQVADITGQIDAILKSRGMAQGTVGERLTELNADPKQLFPNDDEGRAKLLEYLNTLVKAMDARLPQAFSTFPKAKLEIKRVPPFIQDGAPNGYYSSAALDGSRPAIYYINLKSTADWPRYGLPSLTYHEGAPGHHLQISLSHEAKGLPMLRKVSGFGAYVEGWALYAEQLADELGAYKDDPVGKVGFLQSFLFRAVRLVTDTGIHYKRWSREKATDYMVKATGFPATRVQREVDRYCVWPGQACSYKVGHMSWVKVREKAKAIQGAKFDLRRFHQILLEGALPLTILERLVEERARVST